MVSMVHMRTSKLEILVEKVITWLYIFLKIQQIILLKNSVFNIRTTQS